MNKLVLKPGREKTLKRRHPWVFSGAVGKLTGEPAAGETIEVHSSDGELADTVQQRGWGAGYLRGQS